MKIIDFSVFNIYTAGARDVSFNCVVGFTDSVVRIRDYWSRIYLKLIFTAFFTSIDDN